MKKIFLIIFTITLFHSCLAYCGDDDNLSGKTAVKNRYELLSDLRLQDERDFFDVEFTPRRTKAIIFSSLVPGSGQTYLGNELKGMAISILFYGSALTAVIANNNAQGREDRINVLTQEYITKGNYNDAEKVWQNILAEKSDRDNDYKRRSLFSWLSIAIWTYNVFDIFFLTDDQGESQFSMDNEKINLSFVSRNDFNSIVVNLNIP